MPPRTAQVVLSFQPLPLMPASHTKPNLSFCGASNGPMTSRASSLPTPTLTGPLQSTILSLLEASSNSKPPHKTMMSANVPLLPALTIYQHCFGSGKDLPLLPNAPPPSSAFSAFTSATTDTCHAMIICQALPISLLIYCLDDSIGLTHRYLIIFHLFIRRVLHTEYGPRRNRSFPP